MEWREQDPSNCSVGRTLDIVGQPWVLLVLREVFRGLHRFDEIQHHLGISPPVLSRRLDALVGNGLLDKVPYHAPGQRERLEYRLTQAGLDLFPVLLALRQWGDKHAADEQGPATRHTHAGCDANVQVTLSCAEGHILAGATDVVSAPGPGAKPLTR